MVSNLRNHILALLLAPACLCSGCALIPVLATPSYHEAVVPAEFDLTEHTDKRVLVLVDQPGWIATNINMRFYLTEAMDSQLAKNIKIPDPNLIGYDQLAEFRTQNPDSANFSPIQLGAHLNTDLVLDVHIQDLQLDESGDIDYLKGKLNTIAALYDVQTGQRLWPESESGKQIKVGFDIENRGRDIAVARLAAASAHCTTRYLYDCPKKKYSVFDDRGTAGWENWEQ